MSRIKFAPLTRCPGVRGRGCETWIDGSRGKLCSNCANTAEQTKRKKGRRK